MRGGKLANQFLQLPSAAFAEQQYFDADHMIGANPAHDAMCSEGEAVDFEAEIEVIADAARGSLDRKSVV